MRRFEVREIRALKLAQLTLISACALLENNENATRNLIVMFHSAGLAARCLGGRSMKHLAEATTE